MDIKFRNQNLIDMRKYSQDNDKGNQRTTMVRKPKKKPVQMRRKHTNPSEKIGI